MRKPIVGEQQKKEIKTIKKRKIIVELSDADCERLAKQCGEHDLTIGSLIENFIGDLLCGTYSNGSDERDYAEMWFERCWFGKFPEPTLLNHLLREGYDPEDYLDTLNEIETAKRNIVDTQKDIAEPTDEWKHIISNSECTKPSFANQEEYLVHLEECLESYKDDLQEQKEELESMMENWKPERKPDMDKEIERIRKWLANKNELLHAEL